MGRIYCSRTMSAAAETKPLPALSDVVAGATARAASQTTVHPIDTIKVRLQDATGNPGKKLFSARKHAQAVRLIGVLDGSEAGEHLVTSGGGLKVQSGAKMRISAKANGKALTIFFRRALRDLSSLYQGVGVAAVGAGVSVGAYFAFYGAATRAFRGMASRRARQREKAGISARDQLENELKLASTIAFCAGAVGAFGSSFVKVPASVCIRAVQSGRASTGWRAATKVWGVSGWRGLYTGYLPTVLEDVPDMAIKFAAYELFQGLHASLILKPQNRQSTAAEDLAIGCLAGASSAAATTPLDVVKTKMMVAAVSRSSKTAPKLSLVRAASDLLRVGGPGAFFAGVGPRACSSGLNSGIFFCFFETLRKSLATKTCRRTSAASVSNDDANER